MTDETEDTDQYDTLLRAMESGLLISINNATDHALPTGELKVEYSRDDETHVTLGNASERYRIHRNRRNGLIYSEVTEDGLSYEDEVITIEVLGIA